MNLFGEDFLIDVQENTVKDLVKKLSGKNGEEVSPEKLLKSKKLTLEERLNIIKDKVLKTLGKQKDNIIVIKNKEAFDDYIKKAITSGRIDIDTETNNSTDPVTCKLMGPCFYYPGGKQAYVPINHRDYRTKKRLDWQLTEADVAEQLKQIVNSKIDIIMHNGKFDYEVLKCTCGVEVVPKWDTLIAARLIDENTFKDSFVSLKSMYTTYIDPEQEKYSIDELFENIAYADVDPDIFAYYAATDALMTDKVYLWENETFYSKPENKRVKDLFFNIEMPILQVTAEIELKGVYIDQELGARLKQKYNKQLEDLDKEINKILDSIKPIITSWRLTPEANERTKQYVPAKTKMTKEKIEATYTNIDSNGNRYKVGKSRSDQLPDEVNLSSPSQFAILLYDILECPIVDKKNPRATGEDEIKEIADRLKNKTDKDLKATSAFALCNAILERRGLAKLITTYIDVIPDLAKHWPDGRIRYRLNSTGTDTGRFASGGNFRFLDENENPVVLNSINSQNLPSHGDGSLIRLLFQGSTQNHTVDLSDDNCYKVEIGDEVETASGWVNVKNIKIGDIINEDKVVDIKKDDKYFYLYI